MSGRKKVKPRWYLYMHLNYPLLFRSYTSSRAKLLFGASERVCNKYQTNAK